MPRIFDNLKPETKLLPALQETLKVSNRVDFCVGYFNLRGWRNLPPYVDAWNPLVFKLNADKNIGNYNLARCHHITDSTDKILLDALGLGDLWDDVELECDQIVRTTYGDA